MTKGEPGDKRKAKCQATAIRLLMPIALMALNIGGGGREGKRKGEKHVKAFFSSCQFIGTFTAHSIKDRQMGGGGTNSRPDLC